MAFWVWDQVHAQANGNNCNVKPDWSEQMYCPMKMLYTIGCKVLPDGVLGRILVLSLFGHALYGFSAVAPTSDRPLSTLAIGWNSLYFYNNMSMFYTLLHAVLPLLMLQFYWMGITFIYSFKITCFTHFYLLFCLCLCCSFIGRGLSLFTRFVLKGTDGMSVRLSARKPD